MSSGRMLAVALSIPTIAILLVSCASTNKQILSAIDAGDTPRVLALLEDKNAPSGKEKGITPLVKAAAAGNIDVVRALIEAGVNLNVRGYPDDISQSVVLMSTEGGGVNWGGAKSPLMTAIDHRHIDIARILIQAGADVNLGQYDDPMAEKFTPLFSAIRANDLELVTLLIERGAHKWVQALYVSTAGGFMISEGGFARPQSMRKTPITPVQYAELLGRTEIISLIRK